MEKFVGCLVKNDLTDWEPKHPINFYHSTTDDTVSIENYNELMKENKRHFGINDISHGISNSSVPELLKPNLKDLKKYSESYAKIINEENKEKENKLMEKTTETKEMTQAEKDSQFLMETYGNKKAVDAACKKASISDFVSTDKNKFFMNGIFYEKGFAVATDGRMLIKLKKDYPSEWEGKIIDPNTGKEIEGQFPSYEKVFPNKELLKDRSDRLAHISNYLSEATAAIAISEKTKRFKNIVPVMFDNTFVNPRHLQLALSFARDKDFNKVLQEDNYKIDYEPVLDENGKEVYKYYKVGESSEDNLAHKYYTLDELPEDVKKAAYEKIELVGLDNPTNILVENGELWSYDKVEEKKIIYETNLEKPLSRVIEFDAPDGSSILIMPAREPEGPYIDKDGILKNYEDITFIKTKLLGKDEELHKNIVRTLINESDFSDVDVDSIYKKNLEEALTKLNPDVFPKNKKDCQILASVTTYTDVIGENLDRKDFIFEQGQNTATLQQFVCNLWLERFKDYSAHPEHLFVTGENLNPKNTLKMAAEKNIIKEKELDFEQVVQNEFGDALKAQENEKNVKEISKYSFIVKDNSEYGSDFEPVKNLSATEAVRLFQKLNESDISENRFGIALHIPGDKVFGEWAEEGISIVTLDDTEKANFSIYGDTFITQLNESDDRSRTYIDAYKDLYDALEQSSKENSENYGVVYPDFLFEKEKELFPENRNSYKYEQKPVSLEEVLGVMDMRPDYKENGSFMIYDIQKQEYISSWVGWEDDNGAAVFKDASEAFERLDIYINDYYIHDMQEQLEAVGVEISGNETLFDLCNLYKAELEKGNTKLSEGELNLAMGIVEPDTVTYEHKFMKENPLEKVMDASEYDSFLTERLQAEELRYKEIRNTAKETGLSKEKTETQSFDFELRQKHFIDDEIDKGIESIQANGGMSEAALEAEYEAQLREQEMELDDEPEEALPVWPINGEAFYESEIEESLKADVEELFRQYDSGETEKNLTLVGVKMYRDPAKDGKISLLVEFDSKNPENRWREDSLFNALNEEGIEFNGMKVDFNPITKEKSGTIEQYLKQLEGFGNEEEVIKENAQKLEEKEIEQKHNDISNKISDVVSNEKRILPFSIINNKEKGRVNIKFDTTVINRDILKELKAHDWKFAPSTKQWYPVGNAVNTALDFANKLQEKYTEIKNPKFEKPLDLGLEKSPYDGIRFFDRNYNESEEFAKFFNSNIHLFKKGKESAITEEQASTILKAIGYENVGIVEQRRLRIGLDKNDKIVILSSINGKVETQKLEISEVLGFAKEKAAEQVVEAKEILEAYVGKTSTMKKDFQDIFISMYETCIEQAESINKKMQDVYDSFMPKEKEVSKEAILYQRISYRGWEISSDKDFKKSYYVRPFEQTDRSGYILMAGKEGKDGFWQEKFVREMLKSNNWSERESLIETLTRLASDKETCISLGIKEPQSLNGFFSSLDKIIHVENDTDIKNELMESLLGSSESYKASKENIKELSVGDKLGKDSVSDLYKISEGVYQATLSREVNGVGSAQNYFVIDNSIINQLNEELKELVVSFDSKSVIENKNYEPYILKELIEKELMPPRDDDFIQQLDEYISVHPLKYEKLKPVDYLNFERKLQEIAEVDKEFNKTPFELGQQLIALVGENDREKLNNWLKKQGCDSKEHMAKVFASWINKEQKKDIMQKKDNGYPPRGEN